MANRSAKGGSSDRFPLRGLQNHCGLWLQPCNRRWLLLGRRSMTKLNSVLKSRDITLLTKVYIVKAMVFPVVMYSSESWTIKKVEWQRTDAFELWCWRRLLKIPWRARKSNQLILREIKPLIFIGRTDAEAEALVFWSSDVNRLIGKVPSAG